MSNSKMIVIKSNDTIELADYENWESLRKGVGGNFEYFHSTKLPVDPFLAGGKSELPISLICNEEFLIDESEEFDKINAVASLLSGQEIRGNVLMVVDNGDGTNRGFHYKEETPLDGAEPEEALCECWTAEDTVMRYINGTRDKLAELHKQFDGNKSEPQFEIYDAD